MKTATLTLNGKEYEVQLTDEQVIEIEEPKKVTGFERAEEGKSYFSIDAMGTIYSRNMYFKELYNNANYYTDKSLAEWCNRNDTLNRKMRRWAAEHNTEPINLKDDSRKSVILYNGEHCVIDWIRNEHLQSLAFVYFNSDKIAQEAIEEFGEEIKWLAENRPKWF